MAQVVLVLADGQANPGNPYLRLRQPLARQLQPLPGCPFIERFQFSHLLDRVRELVSECPNQGKHQTIGLEILEHQPKP